MKTLSTAILGFALAFGAAPALAHHNANAQWDMSKDIAVTGVLKEVRDISPHAIWAAEVKSPDGKVDLWHFEAISANALRRQGVLVKQDIVPGQTYTFFLKPARDGEKAGFLSGIAIKGKKVTFIRI